MSSMTMHGQLLDPRLRTVYRRRAVGVTYETYLVE
jgi:hypothetical protein